MIFHSKCIQNIFSKPKQLHRTDTSRRFFLGSICLLFILFSHPLTAQDLLGASTRYDDDLTQWILYYDNGGAQAEGRLLLKNPLLPNSNTWIFDFAGMEGEIKLHTIDGNHWVLSGMGERIHIKTVWQDSFCDWKISTNDISVDFSCVYTGDMQNWEMRNNRLGELEIFTTSLNDPRDWGMKYDVDTQVYPLIQLGMLFAAIISSI